MRESFLQDLRFALRLLKRRPGFALAVVLSLALGIGSSTAVFTLLDTVLWRPIRVADAERLVSFYGTLRDPAGEYAGARAFSYEDFADIRGLNSFLSSAALWQWQPLYRTDLTSSERIIGTFVSREYFETLGLRAKLGHLPGSLHEGLLPEDRVAVLSHGYWMRAFGGDESVLGRRLTLNGHGFEIVGVAPLGFKGLDLQVASEVFVPVSQYPQIGTYPQHFSNRQVGLFWIFGKLDEGVSVRQADVGIMTLVRNIVSRLSPDFEKLGARAVPLQEASLRPVDRARYATYGRTLALTSGLLLLVACCNVANLLLLRGLERGRALSIRKALGADRRRLVRQLVTENSLLFGAGGVLGLIFAHGALSLFWRFRPIQFGPGSFEPGVNLVAVSFAVFAVLSVTATFGLFPAARASRLAAVDGLRHRPLSNTVLRRPVSWRSLLVAAQVAVAFAAIAGGSLLMRSLGAARSLDLGFDPDPLYVTRIAPGEQNYERGRAVELYRQVQEDVLGVPGVQAAAWSENRLLRGAVLQYQVFVPGDDEATRIGERDYHRTNIVAPAFFETVGLTMLRGRDFGSEDVEDGPRVAIVNATMARTLWPAEEALGQRFRFDSPAGPELEVVGVIEDARYREVREEPQFFLYLPLSQNYAPSMTLHVRAADDPLDIAAEVNARIRWLAPELVATESQSMGRYVDEALWAERTSALFLLIFAIVASGLAALGIYATVTYTTSQRAPEFGVRKALGATTPQLAWPAFLGGAKVIGGGLAVGWLVAYLWIAPLLMSQLHDVGSFDPTVLAALTFGFGGVGMLSSWVSSRRIAARDTAEVLRADY